MRTVALQWGHALSGMDTWNQTIVVRPVLACFNGAMPFQAWILRQGVQLGCGQWRFNGAMPFQAWIPAFKRTPAATSPSLQWGHALSGMDTGFYFSFRGSMYKASMGPCPFRHGYLSEILHCTYGNSGFNGAMPFQAWIQFLPTGQPHSISGFNGAMPFQAWIPVEYDRYLVQNAGFNGAMPFQAWIRNTATAGSATAAGFNGAMPFQAWILVEVAYASRRVFVLQWGHALSGMDTTRCAGWMDTALCFNGAMPFQAWIHRQSPIRLLWP